MKNPKVGERARAYFGDVGFIDREITNVSGSLVRFGDAGWYDRRQCVRLVNKNKRREFWLTVGDRRSSRVYNDFEIARAHAAVDEDIIHVREVKKK
jgi:hypothetical protein